MLITGVLTGAQPKLVEKNGQSWTFYELIVNDTKYTVGKDTFNQAIGFIGQAVALDAEQNDKGYWRAHSCLSAGSAVQQAATQPGNSATQAVMAAAQAQMNGPLPTQAEKDKDASICRQTAAKALAALHSGSGISIEEFTFQVLKLAVILQTGKTAEQVNTEELYAMAARDSDIPF